MILLFIGCVVSIFTGWLSYLIFRAVKKNPTEGGNPPSDANAYIIALLCYTIMTVVVWYFLMFISFALFFHR